MEKVSTLVERTEIAPRESFESTRIALAVKGAEDFNAASTTIANLTNKALAMHEDMCENPEALTPIIPDVEREGFVESYAPATVVKEVVSTLNKATMLLCAAAEEFTQVMGGNPDILEAKVASVNLAVACQKALLEVETQSATIAAMEKGYLEGVTTHYKTIHARNGVREVLGNLVAPHAS